MSYVVVDFLALALGPKNCDLEMKEFRNGKSLGRIQFDAHVKQIQTIEISLHDLKCKLNSKEEKALFGQFKVITNNEAPKMSDPTYTAIGQYKKIKNQTKFLWTSQNIEDQDSAPKVNIRVSLETLKNSTIQLLLHIDRTFSQVLHEQVIQKINMIQRFQSDKVSRDRKLPISVPESPGLGRKNNAKDNKRQSATSVKQQRTTTMENL